MKTVLGIVLVLLVSGCINTSMNAAEMAACIHTTQTQVINIPNCKTNEECVIEWKKTIDVPTFQHLPVKKEIVEIQHHLIQAWNALRSAQNLLEKANAACEKGNVTSVIQHGLPAAGALQTALQSTEKSHWTTLTALHAAVQRASHEELERIKDTPLYEKYTTALEILHNVATGNETNEWAKEWGKNQKYYSEIGEQLSNQPIPSASFDWKDAFSWYDTGIGIAYPEKKKTIIWFSTVWKSALSSLTKGKTKNTTIALMQSIQAEEMMQSVEISTSPTNGLVIEAVTLIVDIEKEWQALEKMENEKGIELQEKLQQVEEKQKEMKNVINEKEDQWKTLQPFFQAHKIQTTWKEETTIDIETIDLKLENALKNAAEKSQPLGERIETIRKIEKWINDAEASIEKQLEMNNTLENSCNTLQQEMNIEVSENEEEPCAALQLAVQMNALENEENTISSIQLSACTDQVNVLQSALGENTVNPEQFIVEFGLEAALAGCESMKMALENQYTQDPLTQSWMETWKELQMKKEAIMHAMYIHPTHYALNAKWAIPLEKIENKPPILTPEEVETYKETIEELLNAVNQALLTGLQIQINEEKWNITSPQPIGLGEIEAEAEFYIPNPFGQSMNLSGLFTIQTPTSNFHSEEETFLTVTEKIEIEDPFLPKTGLLIKGSGKGEWNTLNAQTTLKQIIGNEATIEAVLSIHAAATSQSTEWNWEIGDETISPPIIAKMDGKAIQVDYFNGKLNGTIAIDESIEEIAIEFTQKGIMDVKTTPLKQEEDQEIVNEWYEVVMTNNTEHQYTTTIKTGVVAPFAGTYTILALDESGHTIKYTMGTLSDIILQDIALSGNDTRTASILISKENENGTPFIQEVLEEEISQWMENEDTAIAAEAQKLWNLIHHNTNPEKWPALAQQVMQLKEQAEKTPEKIELLETTPLTTSENEFSDAYPDEMGTAMLSAKEKMEKYQKIVGIPCTKLAEVGYYCPLDEKTIKEWKKEWDADAKKETQMRKRSTSGKITVEQAKLDEEEAEKSIQRWNQRTQNSQDAIEELEKTAHGLETNLNKLAPHDTREDVKASWEKFQQAIQNEEFGKAIFIGKNLHQYFSSENRLSGLLNIPLMGWPLIGIIFIAGGIFIRNEWKKKKIEPIQLKPLPVVEMEVSPPRAPRDNGESSLPRTRGEYQ